MDQVVRRAQKGPMRQHSDSPAPRLSDAADEDVTRLAERLVRRAAASEDPTDVLVDMQIDGMRCVVVRAPEPRAVPPPQRIRNQALSPREHEIARMVAEGHPNKTIAAVLDVSPWTVNTYLRRIFIKLDVTSRAAMVAKLMK